jgi:sorbitol-specific phosphotransferase system component IIA
MTKKKIKEKVLFTFTDDSFRELCDRINEQLDEMDDCTIEFLSTGKVRISGEVTEPEVIEIDVP